MEADFVRLWPSMGGTPAIDRDSVVILPLAATEQHGPHLPMSTDVDIGWGLLVRAFRSLPAHVPAWALLPKTVGASVEHSRFPGTLSISTEQLIGEIVEQGVELAGRGVRRLVLSNSHGGNRHAMDAAGLRLRNEHGMLVVKANYFRFDRPTGVSRPDTEWRHGLHGGAVETAMMLYLHPEHVLEDSVKDAPSFGLELERTMRRLGPEGQASFAWMAGDLHPTGVTGDARLATARMGEQLVNHYGTALADVIQDAHEFPIDRLG
jgi:creatinine amidohydrolase